MYLGLAGQYAQFDQVAAGRDVMRRLFETAEDPKAHEDAYLSYVAQYEGAEAALVALDELRAKAPDRLDLDVLKATALFWRLKAKARVTVRKPLNYWTL